MKCAYCNKVATEAVFNSSNVVGTPVCGEHSHEGNGKSVNLLLIFSLALAVIGAVMFFFGLFG